jgi:hypothetical protein
MKSVVADAGTVEVVAAYRRAGWLAGLGPSDRVAADALVAAVTPVWGWPPAIGVDQAALLADAERTWSDDVECDLEPGAGIYVTVVAELCRLLGAPIDPAGIEEDWDSVPGTVVVTVRSLRPAVVCRVPATAEILHPAIVDDLNHAFRGGERRLWHVDTGGQMAVITRATAAERAALEAARPVRLTEGAPGWWVEWAESAGPAGAAPASPPLAGPGFGVGPGSPVGGVGQPARSVRLPVLDRGGVVRRGVCAYELLRMPIPFDLSPRGRCSDEEAQAYLAWTEEHFELRAAQTASLLESVGAPPASIDPGSPAWPESLGELGAFLMRWFPEAVAPWYGLEWSWEPAELEAFVWAHANDGTLSGMAALDAGAFVGRKRLKFAADVEAGRAQVFPVRDGLVVALINSLGHDLAFLLADWAGRVRPDLRWQRSRRRIGPGSVPEEGEPVFEPPGQYPNLTSNATAPARAAIVLLWRSLIRPERAFWQSEERWELYDTYQMLVTGQPSSRSFPGRTGDVRPEP